jgi:beta-N-acetylhexosaminidase
VSQRRLALGTLLGAFNGRVAPAWVSDLASSGIAGFVLFKDNVDDVAALCSSLRVTRRELLIAIDEEGGDVTRLWRRVGSPYPGNAALGVADDEALTRSIYGAIGSHLADVGINLDLAPVADVNTTDDNPVIGTRSFGADTALVSRHMAAAVRGLHDGGVAACAKHFPGHGATTVDSHLALPTVDATQLPPFRAAIEAGVPAIMTAHIRVPSLTGAAPATFSPEAMRLLRNDLGFTGVIVTDALEMQAAAAYAGGIPAGAVLALAAGADLLCLGARVTPELVEAVVCEIVAAVHDGRLPESRLLDAASRVRSLALAAAMTGRSAARAPAVTKESGTGGGRQQTLSDEAHLRVDVDLGRNAARRAISVDGILPDLSAALFVQFSTSATIAEGRVPWGLVPHVVDGIAVDPATSPGKIASIARDRPLVIVARNLHRLRGARELVESLATTHDVVLVEMGWPSRPFPEHVRATLTTYGATRATARAVVAMMSANPRF